MSDLKLHEGMLTRQVLRGRTQIRVAFIPDKPGDPLQSIRIKIEEDNKIAWESLLGEVLDFDINLGVLILRFNPDNLGGTATFLPHPLSQSEIVRTFQQSAPDLDGTDTGTGDFFSCIEGRRTAEGTNFNLPSAVAACLPQLLI
jgi:hypothetical protein